MLTTYASDVFVKSFPSTCKRRVDRCNVGLCLSGQFRVLLVYLICIAVAERLRYKSTTTCFFARLGGKQTTGKMTVFRRVSLLVAAGMLLLALMADRCDADPVSGSFFPVCF